MKKTILLLVFLICSFYTKASHMAGADLTYKWIGGNDWEITFTFYRDCSGISEDSCALIRFNSQSCGLSFTTNLPKIPGTGQEITQPCPGQVTTCSGGTIYGIREYVYRGTVTLQPCSDWVMYYCQCCRNPAIVTITNASGNGTFILATLNNTATATGSGNPNSSPVFSNKPNFISCANQQIYYNHGATDIDGDFLVYSLIAPYDVGPSPYSSSCSGNGGVTVSYIAPWSALQPLTSNPPVAIDSLTGEISMFPTLQITTVMAVLVREYRGTTLIGSVIRDMQFTLVACSNNLPVLPGIDTAATSYDPNDTIYTWQMFPGNSLSFDIYPYDPDPGSNLTLSWDNGIPSALWSVTNNGTPNAVGHFSWIPDASAISNVPHCFNVIVNDNACPYYGTQVFSYCILVQFGSITGTIYNDVNGNCVKDTSEAGIHGWLVKVDPGPLYRTTDITGYYNITVPQGTFTVSQILLNPYWGQICPPSGFYTAVINNLGDVSPNNDFADQIVIYCPHLEVDISSGTLLPCSNTAYSVYYCNTGTASADSAYIEIEFDTLLTPLSSTLPWSSQNGNVYTFSLGTIQPGQCGWFQITVFVSCNTIMGSTLCVEAKIYPDTLCLPTDSTWDHSSVSVEGECVNDSLACFTIYNTGDPFTGDMQGTSEYRIYENNVLVFSGQFQLTGGDSLIICWPTNGNAIRLEADQRPGHPGNSHPQETIENCGDSNGISLGQIIVIPEDDQDDNIEIDCKEVTGPIDPNEKCVKPVGLTQYHYIDSTDVLEYQINFQNTGTAPAINIIIKDTLSQYLDVATVVCGVSSHPYSFIIYGQGIMEWKFDNIMLPDSNTNEPASHGFVKFKVNQSPDNSQGTLIENRAGIIFDFNAAVITDIVWNIVYDTNFVASVNPVVYNKTVEVNVFPNPFSDYTTFVITGMDKTEHYSLILYDLMGKAVKRSSNIQSNIFNFRKDKLPSGMYFYKLHNDNGTIAVGKIIIN